MNDWFSSWQEKPLRKKNTFDFEDWCHNDRKNDKTSNFYISLLPEIRFMNIDSIVEDTTEINDYGITGIYR